MVAVLDSVHQKTAAPCHSGGDFHRDNIQPNSGVFEFRQGCERMPGHAVRALGAMGKSGRVAIRVYGKTAFNFSVRKPGRNLNLRKAPWAFSS